MENPTSILLYSKYSPHSKQITDLIQSSPVPLQFKYFCVDNKQVREQIQNDKKININFLPCILNVYSNGGVEQFEGPQAFNAVQSILASLPPPIPPPNQIHAPEPIEEYQDPPPAPKQREVRRRPPPVQRPKPRSQRERSPSPEPIESGSTSINDLPSSDDDEFEREVIRKPRRRVRADKGNYIEESGDEYEPPEHNIAGLRQVRKNTDKNIRDGETDLAMKAQELAKQREQADQQFKPRGPAIPTEMRRE
jgi:hypothetical protein